MWAGVHCCSGLASQLFGECLGVDHGVSPPIDDDQIGREMGADADAFARDGVDPQHRPCTVLSHCVDRRSSGADSHRVDVLGRPR